MYIVFSCTTWNDEWVPFARLGWGRFFGTFSPGDKADAADGTAQEEIDAAKATKICQSMATGNLNRTVPGLLGGTQILLNLCNKYISYICIECICIYIYIYNYIHTKWIQYQYLGKPAIAIPIDKQAIATMFPGQFYFSQYQKPSDQHTSSRHVTLYRYSIIISRKCLQLQLFLTCFCYSRANWHRPGGTPFQNVAHLPTLFRWWCSTSLVFNTQCPIFFWNGRFFQILGSTTN